MSVCLSVWDEKVTKLFVDKIILGGVKNIWFEEKNLKFFEKLKLFVF